MKKTFTLNGKRMLLALFALVAFAVNASAGSTWYAYYSKVTSYPTGKGQVYVSEDYSAEPTDNDYKDVAEYQSVSTAGSLVVFAKPADGYQFAGISQATPVYDELGTITGYEFSDQITVTGNPAFLSLTSGVTDNPTGDESVTSDSLTVAGMMPLDPNNVFYALFTKVTVTVAENQSSIGSASISKVCNDKGDEITLTAFPGEGSTFLGWTLNGDTISKEPEYKITVGDETAEYVANFDNPNLITLHFDEYGSYINWCDSVNDLTMPEGVTAYSFYADSTVVAGENGEQSYTTPFESTYNVSCQNPYLIYGFGDVKVLKTVADPEYIYVNDYMLNRWSGDKGVTVSELDNTYAYYTIDMPYGQLNLATESIPAQQVYVAMPDSVYKNAGLTVAPAIIYTSLGYVPEGIKTVSVNMPGNGKMYAVDGKQLVAPKRNALYIKNGKKYIKR